MSLSPAESLALLPAPEREAWVREQGEEAIAALEASWHFWSRPEQLAPVGDWRWWLVMTGRGWGKNRTAAEWVLDRCELFARAGMSHLVGLIGRSFGDVRATMIEGPGGLAACAKRRGYVFSHTPTGLTATLKIGSHVTDFELFTDVKPDQVRGRNLNTVWLDELAAWRHKGDAEGGTTFTNTDLALRADARGLPPRGIITTTPKPVMLLRELVRGDYGDVALTTGRLFDNMRNLSPAFVRAVLKRYHGTRLGAQEIEGILLDDVEGALWTQALIHAWRRTTQQQHVERVVGVDPAGGVRTETGIVVAGLWADNPDPMRKHCDVLEDASIAGLPEEWGARVVEMYHTWGCTRVAAERNFGGEMVRSTIHAVDPSVIVELVNASKGKTPRAEPISIYYQQGRVHHVGVFGDMEAELTTWVDEQGMASPNRLDALVWAITALMPPDGVFPASTESPNRAGTSRPAVFDPPRGGLNSGVRRASGLYVPDTIAA